MSIVKTTFIDYSTVIDADFLNDLQDEIIDKCVTVDSKTFSSTQQAQARTNIGAVGTADLSAAVDAVKLLVVSGTISESNRTISNAGITADMVVANAVIGTPSAQAGDWTVTTAAGSVTISGSISGSTTVTLYLALAQ